MAAFGWASIESYASEGPMRLTFLAPAILAFTLSPRLSLAGAIFLSGHDSDFHASIGFNTPGAQTIVVDALNYARGGNTAPILLLETDLSNLGLGDHTDSEAGLVASGYTAASSAGNHYVKVSASQFAGIDL